MSSSEKEDLSFSEWCDRTFTNMYSHSDFVMSPSRSLGREIRPRGRGRLQTAQAHQDKRMTVCRQQKDTPRSASLNRSGTEDFITIQSDDCLQARRSSSLDRWHKHTSEGLKSDPRTFSEDRNPDKNEPSVTEDSRAVCVTTDDVQCDKSRRRLRNPENVVIKNDHPRSDIHVPKMTVESVSLEQESHATKRCHSEMSPCRKSTKSNKAKKRLRSSGSCPEKCKGPESPSVTGSCGDLKRSVTDVSVCNDDQQDISGVGCELNHTREVKKASTQDIKRDSSKVVLKEKVESLKKKEHKSLVSQSCDTDTATEMKHGDNGKASTISEVHSAENTGSVISGEFEVDSANNEDRKHGVCLQVSGRVSVDCKQRSRKNKPTTCRGIALGKDTETMTPGNMMREASSASSSISQHGNCIKDKLERDKGHHQAFAEMLDEHSWIKVHHKKKSRTKSKRGVGHKIPHEKQKQKIGSGEYDVESSLDGSSTKQEYVESVFNERVMNDASQMDQKEGSVTEVNKKLTNVNISESSCFMSSCTCKSSIKSKEGKLQKTTTSKKLKSERRSCDRLDNEQIKETRGERRRVEANHHEEPSASPSRIQGTSREVEEIENSCVKTTPSLKFSRVRSNVQEKGSTKPKESKSLSPKLRLKEKTDTSLFTKRVFQSVLKPPDTLQYATSHSYPNSAETASKRINRPPRMQRKLSWPAAKVHVHLEHIYQAFDCAANTSSDDDSKSRTLDSKETTDKAAESTGKSPEETNGFKDLQKLQQSVWQNETPPPLYATPVSSKTPQMQMKWGTCTSEVQRLECFTEPAPTENGSKSRSLNPEAKRFVPKFSPRNTSEEKISAAVEKPCMMTDTCIPPGHASSEMTKKSYVVEWLKNLEGHQESAPLSCNPVPAAEERKARQSLKVGEPSDSDESWDRVIDSIMRIEHEDMFCKRVEQTHHTTSPRSVTPFRIALNMVDLKTKAFVERKNVATVSPFCVHPPTFQLKTLPCTWSGPMPNFGDQNCSLETTFPFTTRSPGNTNAENTTGRTSVKSGTTPTIKRNQVSNSKSTSSPRPCTSNRMPVVDTAPRFLRLAQLKAKSREVNESVTSHASSVCSGCTDHENVPSTPVSQPKSPMLGMVSSHTEVHCKQEFRPWSSGSAGWSSANTRRTPGTITPTRFTSWTNEISSPSPWKASQGHQQTVEHSASTVNYPVSSIPYIDTHCHIDFLFQRLEYHDTFENFSRTHNFPKNYTGCLAVFCTPEGFKRGALWEDLVLEKSIWTAFGCHPHHAKSYDGVVEENIIRCMKHPKAIALGEIGLDYSNRCSSDRPLQLQVFRRQLQIALHLQKPLVIHSRDAEQDTLNVMKEMVPRTYKIHRHCFTGSPQEAKNFFRAFPNSFIGLTALVTFPTAYPVHHTATEIPLEKILLETDAPYFLPKQCPRTMRWADPSMAIFVASRIAQLRRLPLDEVLLTIRQNTAKMYGI